MHDFQVKWQGNVEDTTKEIVRHILVSPLRSGMPKTIALVGKSRAGKSVFGLLLQEIVYESYGIKFVDIVDKVVLIKPTDYSKKLKDILKGETDLHKQCRTLQMDEAKFLINSDDWQKLKNKTIRTVAATSASIKPLLFFIVAQLLGDIDSKTRRTIDYLFIVKRSPGKKPRVIPYVFYEKINDLDRVKIVPRRMVGLIEYPNGKVVEYTPTFRPSLPSKEVLDKYHSFEQKDKSEEIFSLLEDIEKEANKLSGQSENKLKEFAQYLVNNPAELAKLGKWSKASGKWKFSKTEMGRYNYDSQEYKSIENYVEGMFKENKAKELKEYGNESDVSIQNNQS